jgi:hypothetical protein
MSYAISLLGVVPMRKEAAHRSEMVSQLLFGEYAEVFEAEGDFTRVKGMYDNYEGWVQTSQLTPVPRVLHTDLYLAHWSDRIAVNDQYRHVPLGSPLYAASGAVTFGTDVVRYELPPSAIRQGRTELMNAASLLPVYSLFLHTPYLWGGKSVFGIDCSGFAQQVFKLVGIRLPRDAYQQAEQGAAVGSLEEARAGDLAFFTNDAGRVTHVGILLGPDSIVHAAGQVRIDPIDAEGIIHAGSGSRTHRLSSIRRVGSSK